jgi:GTP-binding protein YchF
MQIGIVGLPFAGKTTLFQAVTKAHLDPSALGRAEAHHAVVKVPDQRLDTLSTLFSPQRTVYATIEFVDVIGLKKGEAGSAQFTNHFLGNVKTNDALVQVVRVFSNETTPHPDGQVDIIRDIATFETEFILSDLLVIETRAERIKKQLQKSSDDRLRKELVVLERVRQILEGETPLRQLDFHKDEVEILKTYQLLSIKPMLIALNFDESQHDIMEESTRSVVEKKSGKRTSVVSFLGKVEQEMSELPDAEVLEFMREYRVKESALVTLIREAYALLGLQSFFTVGEDECRAWTIRKGMLAQEAAGVIHSSFVTKFIRAEVVHYDHFVTHGGSFQRLKEAGLWRLEGKNYAVKDGDIISIRHS